MSGEAEAAAAASSGVKRYASKFASEDDYFDDQDEDEQVESSNKKAQDDDDDEEEDPLDAFMADLAKSDTDSKKKDTKSKSSVVQKPSTTSAVSAKVDKSRPVRQDIEEEDHEESYYRYMKENPNAGIGTLAGSDDENPDGGVLVEYDEDGNPLPANAKKLIDPLPMVYHSQINYPPFEKNFYVEHQEIKSLNAAEIMDLRRKLGIRVSGPSPPKPVTSFAHFGFDEQLMKTIRKMEYTQPTPIQAQVGV